MNKTTVLRVGFALILCGLCSCVSKAVDQRAPDDYEVTVDFISPMQKTFHTIEITAHLGVPFGVKTQDEVGNHYQVAGTLWQRTKDSFRLDKSTIGFRIADGSFSSSDTMDNLDLKLGEARGEAAVGGAILYGWSIRITKR